MQAKHSSKEMNLKTPSISPLSPNLLSSGHLITATGKENKTLGKKSLWQDGQRQSQRALQGRRAACISMVSDTTALYGTQELAKSMEGRKTTWIPYLVPRI